MTGRGATLELRHVTATYDGHVALRQLSLEVRSGELLSLLGANGSGKSTVLRTLGGLVEPEHGQVLIDEAVVSASERRSSTALLYGDYGLHGEMTVTDNIAHALRPRRLDRQEVHRRTGAMLELLDLEHLARKEVARLSAGEKQRANLARVMALGARAMLLHEPLSQVDGNFIADFRERFRGMQRSSGVTVVMAPRDRVTALGISDRVAVLRDGAVAQVATPTELYMHPNSGYVAEAVGEVNRLPGSLMAHDPDAARVLVATDVGYVWSVGSGQVGDDVELLIRPEAFSLTSTPEAQALTGRLDKVLFCGTHYRLRVDVAGRPVTALVSPWSGVRVETGETVELYVAPSACRSVPA